MGKYSKTPDEDIARQPYRGPDQIAAAAGEGFIAHFQWAVAGLVGGGLLTWAFHRPVLKHVDDLRHAAKHWVHGNRFQQACGELVLSIFGHGLHENIPPHKMKHMNDVYQHGFGLWMLNHTIGLSETGRKFIAEKLINDADRRASIAVTGGGLFAFLGYTVLPWAVSFKGAKRGTEGRNQFERAKDEIWDLRAENDQLRTKNAELKLRATESEQNEANRLNVSSDQPPVIQHDPAAPEPEPKHAPEKPHAPSEREWSEVVKTQKAEAAAKEPGLV